MNQAMVRGCVEGGMIDAGRMGQECVRSLSPVLGDLHPSEGSLGATICAGWGAESVRQQAQLHQSPSEMHQADEYFLSLPKVHTLPHLLLGLKNITLDFSESSI